MISDPHVRQGESGAPSTAGRPAIARALDVDVVEIGWGIRAEKAPRAPVYATLEAACATEFPRLVRLLTLYCGSREVALDLAQETLARGLVHWPRVARMSYQRAWFTRVALNLANSRWRRLKVEHRAIASAAVTPSTAETADLATALTVRAAVAALTPRQRTAVVLRYFDDFDLATTADLMRCSPGTVKKLTARGIASLKIALDIEEPTEDCDV